MELFELTAFELQGLIKNKSITAVELANSVLNRYKNLDDKLKSWVYMDEESFLNTAQSLDSDSGINKPLKGIPVGLKDIYYTESIPTKAGSKVYEDFVPEFDATTVTKLKESQANIMGKTVTTEFACLDPSEAVNPWNPAHTPGGSSSGSAVAVASMMCPIALGSQTVGSVLRPAAYNGIVGFKPTSGLVSRFGVVPVSWNLDTIGWLTRSVQDAALTLDNLIGYDPNDNISQKFHRSEFSNNLVGESKKKVALLTGYFTNDIDPEIKAHVYDLVKQLLSNGFEVEEIAPTVDFGKAFKDQRLVMAVEAAAFHRENFKTKADLYRPKLRAMLQQGLEYGAIPYSEALSDLKQFKFDMINFSDQYDFLITPSTPELPPGDLNTTGSPMFQGPWTAIDFPAISLPIGLSESGLPIGAQLIASPFKDLELLQAAYQIESIVGFDARPNC